MLGPYKVCDTTYIWVDIFIIQFACLFGHIPYRKRCIHNSVFIYVP